MNLDNKKEEMRQIISYMKAERDKKGRYIPYGEAIALWLTVSEQEIGVVSNAKKELN